jgi:thioredoxin
MSSFGDLIQSEKPVLVDFFAEWCGPCKMMAPILQQVKAKMGEDIRIVKIDVDKNTAVAQTFGIQGVPTLIIFQKGKVKWRQSGVVQAGKLEEALRQYL